MRGQRVRKNSPFFLIVRIKLKVGELRNFINKMPGLSASFQANQFELLLAGVSQDKAKRPQVLHLWHMPSADQLLVGMALLADYIPYTEIDDLILEEVQDLGTPSQSYVNLQSELLRPWRARHGKPKKERELDRYLLVTESVKGPALAEYGALYESRLNDFNQTNGWKLGQGLLRITGELNRVSRAWIVPKNLTLHRAKQILTTAPGASCVKQRETWAHFFDEAPYEALFNQGPRRPAPPLGAPSPVAPGPL
jgi:hypothetical protein